MRSKKDNARVALAGDAFSTPINSAFAHLANKMPQIASSSATSDVRPTRAVVATRTPEQELDAILRRLRRVHAFKSKKGRGGKTVTEIDHLESIAPPLLTLLCQRLCRRFGCGGRVEGLSIVLQGDQTVLVTEFFAAARAQTAF